MSVELRLRRALLAAAAVTYLGAAVEMALVEHYDGVWQLMPFALVAAGLGTVGAAWPAPTARPWLLAGVGAVVVVGSVLGVYFHLEGNWALAAEVRPDEPLASRVWHALSGGNPLLAPGMVGLAGALGAAAGLGSGDQTDD